MKIPFCTCEVGAKETFSTGFVIVGFLLYLVLVPFIIAMTIMEEAWVPLLAVWAIFFVTWTWSAVESFRQARFKGHTERCARRFAFIAATSTIKGYDPTYPKLNGYVSLPEEWAVSLFGKRRAKKLFMGSVVLWWVMLGLFMAGSSYVDLTRERNGLPDISAKYTPVVTEGVVSGLFLIIPILMTYAHFEKRVRSMRLLGAGVTAFYLLLWLGFIFLLSWYARDSFSETLLEILIIFGFAFVVILIPMGIYRLWQKLKPKRKRHRTRRAKSAHS